MSQQPRRQVVLYFGNDWEAENRTSSHHIAEQLSKHFEVHYIECPGLRAPTTSTRDLKKIFRKLRRCFSSPRQVSDTLWIHTLLQLPYHRFGFIRRLNTRLMHWWMNRIIRRNFIQNPITWFTIPHVASLAKTLGEAVTVYYCIDDYAALPGVDETAVSNMERLLTSRADVVFVASATLYEAKRQVNEHTYVSPHGVDVHHFGAALEDGKIPEDIACLKRPLIGFFGLIEKWIDLDLIEYVATHRPDWEFVMIGRIAVGQHRLMSLPNVHFLGRRPYSSLPDYGRAFDVAIIPYRLTQQVQNANPLKLREYLAMGKPIVAVRTSEIEMFSDVVEIADNSEQFLERLDAALDQDQSNSAHINARVSRVADSSWEARVTSVLKVVQQHLDGKRETLIPTSCAEQFPVENLTS